MCEAVPWSQAISWRSNISKETSGEGTDGKPTHCRQPAVPERLCAHDLAVHGRKIKETSTGTWKELRVYSGVTCAAVSPFALPRNP